MCASCDCGCKPGKPERGCTCKCKMCRAARSSEQVGKAKFFGGKFVARKTSEVTAANAEAMRASFRAAAKDAEESAERIARTADRSAEHAGRVFRRSAAVGGVSLGSGLSIPVVVHHEMAGKRERKRPKMSVAKDSRWPDKKENKVVRRKLLKDPAMYGLTAAQAAAGGAVGYGGYKYLTQEGPLLRRKYPPNMQVLQPDNAGVFRPVPFRNGVRGLTGRGKLAVLAGGGLLASEIANKGGQARSHRVANRAREEAGYPRRTFWTGKQVSSLKTETHIKKAWKGEPGDKRNSKYALAALSGTVVPGMGNITVPLGYGIYRNKNRDGMRRREISIANSKKEREMKRKKREERKIKKFFGSQSRSVMSKQNYLLGSGVTLVDLSKAMSPNKYRALSRMSNGGSRIPRQQADYARNRLASYRVGEGASPSPSLRGRFVESATNASASSARKAKNFGQGPQSFNAGITNSTGRTGGYNQSIAARKIRMNNSFRDRPRLP